MGIYPRERKFCPDARQNTNRKYEYGLCKRAVGAIIAQYTRIKTEARLYAQPKHSSLENKRSIRMHSSSGSFTAGKKTGIRRIFPTDFRQ